VGLIQKVGTWFSYGDMRIGQGRDNAREFLENNPEVAAEIEAKLREKLGLARSRSPLPETPVVAEAPTKNSKEPVRR
jgi:recombination protein RecA